MTDRLHAPYNFVPLSGHVFQPDWADLVSHDIPHEHGLSGRIRYRLTSYTPLVVGGAHRQATASTPGRVDFFELPDGELAIPGSSLRGMIRNVLEIASFGKMQAIDDRRFSLRDLTGAAKQDYTDRMVGKSQAGWLSFDMTTKRWRIRPCAHARITYDRIAKLAKCPTDRFTAPAAKTAMQKYKAWTSSKPHDGLKVNVVVAPGEDRFVPRECYLPPERACDKAVRGTLVFTGQLPVRNRRAQKKREFVFLDGTAEPVDVPHETMEGFIDIHENFDESAEWVYWRQRHFRDREDIPVFYLWEDGQISSLGLAMMFKVAPPFSTHQMRSHTATLDGTLIEGGDPHAREQDPDLADLVFGAVHDDDADGLRGRVSFGMARLTNRNQVQLRDHGPGVLGSPKPSYFPAYLRQPMNLREPWKLTQGDGYRTYFDAEGELAGWKRYPVHVQGRKKLPPLNDANRNNQKVQIELQAIEDPDGGGAVFEGWLRFHNMTPVELGAVFWAMTWGGSDKHRHALGMAKAHGFGQVSFELLHDELEIDANDGRTLDPPAEIETCMTAFVDEMNRWAGPRDQDLAKGWRQSPQIQRLLAMADPKMADQWTASLRHMVLDPQNKRNDFVDAKAKKFVLPPYGEAALERDRHPVGAKSRTASTPPAAARPTPETLAPPTDPNLLLPKDTEVFYAGEPGRLTEPLRRGMQEIGVDFDGEIEPVSVDELELP